MSETNPEKSYQNPTSQVFNIFSLMNQLFNKLIKREWESHLYGILNHPTEAKVLILSSKTGCYLPHVSLNEDIGCDDIGDIKKAFEEKLGISVNILYYADNYFDKSKREIHSVYVLEQNNPTAKLNEGSWINLESLQNLCLKIPEHQSIIEEYLKEIESGNVPELRPPWARKGWFTSANQWIEDQLLELNFEQPLSVECIKSWGISCVLKVNTKSGNFYLKEASRLPLFCDEPVVTSELAKFFPEHIPRVLSINPERHWMLLADFGEPIARNTAINQKKDVYRLLAQIQIKSVEHIDNLLHVGCLDRRLEKLATQIDIIFNDENSLSQLKESEIKQLQKISPSLKRLCAQLADYKIPQTLVHGDLHLGNVALYNDNYLLFDWTDSCISHPFFDMFQFYFRRSYNPLSPLKSLRDEYLAQWTIYESKSRILAAWELAKPLCALHHAVTYKYITDSLEPRAKQEFSMALPNFIRRLLQCNFEENYK